LDETLYVLKEPVMIGMGDQEHLIEAYTLLPVPHGERHRYGFADQEGELIWLKFRKLAGARYRELQDCPAMPQDRLSES